MVIQFACPHCGSAQNADERYAGLSGPCTSCGQTISVPAAAPLKDLPVKAPGRGSGGGSHVGGVLLTVGLGALLLLMVCGGVGAALLLPALSSGREAARRMQSTNNARQILLAMHNYADVHGAFPPAYIADDQGRPMHSWRVLLLPYLEQAALHQQYDFNQPWDSPQNMLLANTVPAVYRSPLDDPKSPHTSYMFFIGPGTAYEDPTQPLKMETITDGLSNTAAVVEVNGSGIPWTQPTDLDAAQLDFIIRSMTNAQPGQINSATESGTRIGLFDGSVREISHSIAPALLRSVVHPKDGGPLGNY